MRIDIFDQTVELAVNRSIVLHEARNAEVVCTNGRIWITEDPLRNDIILKAGQSHVVQVGGMTFVTAIQPSTVWLRDPARTEMLPRSPAPFYSLTEAARRLLSRWRGQVSGHGAVA